MARNKTDFTGEDVYAFIAALENGEKRKDSYELIALMELVSGEKARMWGATIIGFGSYSYRYESGHEGNAPLIGFSPRKQAFSLYVFTGLEEHRFLLDQLGKFTMGKACIYIKKMEDIQTDTLKRLMEHTIDFLSKKYTRTAHE